VDIQFEARKAAARQIAAAKLGLVAAGGDAPELLEPLEAVLDQATPWAHFGVVRIGVVRSAFAGMTAMAPPSLRMARKASLSNALSAIRASKSDAGEEWRDADAVVTLAVQGDETRQIAQRVDARDDLDGQPAARGADGLILSPLFAPALSAVKNGCGRDIGFSADGGSISARMVVMRARQSIASQASSLRKL
jgi:hypothetical protein